MFVLSIVTHGSTLFWVLVSSAFGAAGVFILSILIKYRTKKLLEEPVPEIQQEVIYTAVQIEELREILAGTGYAYDWKQDVFYSVKNPWQKRFGYCRLYDETAAPLGMVIDCEPIEFDYAGKRWMIELWKGQYGMTTGAEIGIYNTNRPEIDITEVFTGTFYQCAEEADYLSMTYTLIKDSQVLFRKAGRHWWLTGFRLGMYSKPSDLKLEVSINFKDHVMRNAFLESLSKLGYKGNEVRVSGNTVLVIYTKPHSKQPGTRKGFAAFIAQNHNKWLVREYRRLTQDKENMYEILTLLKERSPLLFSLVMKIGRQKEAFSQYETIKKYLD